MERRKAITAATGATLTLLAGGVGIALNSGIVGANGDGNVGKLTPVLPASPPVTVYVDDPPAASPTTAPAAHATAATTTLVPAPPPVQPSAAAPVARSSASPASSEGGSGRHGGDAHETDDHAEFEGASDDD